MDRKVKVALTGASGNMGERLFATLLPEEFIEEVRILNHDPKGTKKILKANKKFKDKVVVIDGSIANKEVVQELIKGVDYVLNLAAAIPPESDKFPEHAIEANEIGVKVLVEAIEEIKENQPKLIHTCTMGIYGDRREQHLFGEVGDPLLISPLDIYALTKMRGELTVIESNIKTWAVIRQSAMLYDAMMSKNISDGLMFHNCVNSPLEWTTSNISAVLYRNILRRDVFEGDLDENNFWKHVFNLGGGDYNRITGFECMEMGFKIIGGNFFQFFEPNYVCFRNFHGVWFYDGHKLEDLFHYQGDTVEGFWKHVLDTHKYYNMAKIFPKKWLKGMIIKPLLKDANAPMYWYKHKDEARMNAYFNGSDKYERLPKTWDGFNILALGKDRDGNPVDYEYLKTHPNRLNHYFDIDKPRSEVDINDLRSVAEGHAGKLITEDFKKGDIFAKVEWEDQDGNRFVMRPHSVLFCGHWNNVSYHEHVWDFDRLAKKDKIYAQIWYDQHEKDEDRYYYFDDKYVAHYKDLDK